MLSLANSAMAQECQRQTCTILGTDGDDMLVGTPGRDVICGFDGDDTILGKEGPDVICGGRGNDLLYGGDGDDILVGEMGHDELFGEAGNDELYGNQGNDRLLGGDDSDYLIGDNGRDILDGEIGDDFCVSRSEDKTLLNCVTSINEYIGIRLGSNSPSDNGSTVNMAKSARNSFSIENGQIIGLDGLPFVVRGINIFPWHGAPNMVAKITSDCWQFNTVRLHSWILPYDTGNWKDHVVYVDQPSLFDFDTVAYTTYDIAPMIDYYTAQGTVVIVDIHDKIGRYFEAQELEDYLTFMRDFLTRYNDNPYVWVDIHNEPGGMDGVDQDFTQWRTEMPTLMNDMRAIAPTKMLLMSGTAWGQDTGPRWSSQPVAASESALLANADVITAYSNVIATFHVYDQWSYGGVSRLDDYVSRLQMTLNTPIVVGEYGSYNNNSTIAALRNLRDMLQLSGNEEVGRVAWVWDAYDNNNLTTKWSGGGQWVDSCSAPTNLTEFGQIVWEDNH